MQISSSLKTSDSKLTLRCSSTQAQILWLDSVDLKIVLVNGDQSIAEQLQTGSNSWLKRRVPNHQIAAYQNQQTLTKNNQVRLLHQQNAKSSAAKVHSFIGHSTRIIVFAIVFLQSIYSSSLSYFLVIQCD